MAYPYSSNPFPGQVGPIGGPYWVAVHPTGHAGPSSYTQMTTGPLAGGDTLQAVEMGLKSIISVRGGLTSDGLYRVEPAMATSGPATSVKLRWTVVSSGAQVGGGIDLHASSVNLEAIGLA